MANPPKIFNMLKKLLLLIFLVTPYSLYSAPIIYAPENNEQINSDFYFICYWDGENRPALEVANDNNFENIVFTNSNRWLIVDGAYWQFPMSPSELGNGTFYWRINYGNGYTSTYTITIYDQPETSDDYNIIRDNNEYPNLFITGYDAPIGLSSLWIRSENTSNGLGQTDEGGYNHSMIVKDNVVYISYEANFTNAPILHRYDAQTGETLEPMAIDYGNFSQPSGALCDLNVDDFGNIYTTNRGYIKTSSTVNLYVDLLELNKETSTAKVTKRFTCILPTQSVIGMSQQVFYAKAAGNVATGEFSLYSVLNGNLNNTPFYGVYKWIFSNNISSCEGSDVAKIITTTTTPKTRIHIIDAENDYYILDNNVIHPTIYKGGTSKKDFSKEGTFDVSTDYTGNGMCVFKHGNVPMMLYGCNFKTNGSKFELITLSTNFFDGTSSKVETFEGIKSLWKFPNDYLGNVTPTQPSTIAATTTETTTDGYPRTKIYIYSAGNGLAAYQLSHYTTTGISSPTLSETVPFSCANGVLTFHKAGEPIELYTTTGVLVVKAAGTQSLDLSHLSSGIYIAYINNKAYKIKL